MKLNIHSVLSNLIQNFKYKPEQASPTLSYTDQKCIESLISLINQFSEGAVECDEEEEFFIELDDEFNRTQDDQTACSRKRASAEFRSQAEDENKELSDDPDYISTSEEHNYTLVNEKFTTAQIQSVESALRAGKSQGKIAKKLKLSTGDVFNIKRYLDRGKTSEIEKYKQIKEAVVENFLLARQTGKPVLAIDFEFWIAMAVKKYNSIKNCSSQSFFNKLKKDARIKSRKVTKFTTTVNIQNEQNLREDAFEFAEKLNEYCDLNGIADQDVFNSDQSKFEYELVSDRTYEIQGAKHVESLVVATNSLSHSYTLQVHINKAGFIGSHFYLCFQEVGGRFGPNVVKSIDEELSRIKGLGVIEASTSGKLTKKHVDSWLVKCLQPDLNPEAESILVLDAWSGHEHVKSEDSSEENQIENLTIKILPKSTTRFSQPLDIFFSGSIRLLSKRLCTKYG